MPEPELEELGLSLLEVPDEPEVPEVPDEPDEPEVPDVPDELEAPEAPEESDELDEPDAPEDPGDEVLGLVDDEPEAPGDDDMPEAPDEESGLAPPGAADDAPPLPPMLEPALPLSDELELEDPDGLEGVEVSGGVVGAADGGVADGDVVEGEVAVPAPLEAPEELLAPGDAGASVSDFPQPAKARANALAANKTVVDFFSTSIMVPFNRIIDSTIS